MIEFICNYKMKNSIEDISKMDYKELLKEEYDFCIKINDEDFYKQPLFPILEFLYFYTKWDKNEDFVYNSIESDETPMILIKKTPKGWTIDSVWKKFKCDTYFHIDEIVKAIEDMISYMKK